LRWLLLLLKEKKFLDSTILSRPPCFPA
jgi:hypothetical protein